MQRTRRHSVSALPSSLSFDFAALREDNRQVAELQEADGALIAYGAVKVKRLEWQLGATYTVHQKKRLHFAVMTDKMLQNHRAHDRHFHFFTSSLPSKYAKSGQYNGPIDAGILISFCRELRGKIDSDLLQDHKIVYYCAPDPAIITNSALCIACYLLFEQGHTPEEAVCPFVRISPSPLVSFRDCSSSQQSDYALSLVSCVKGISKAFRRGCIDLDAFDFVEYQQLQKLGCTKFTSKFIGCSTPSNSKVFKSVLSEFSKREVRMVVHIVGSEQRKDTARQCGEDDFSAFTHAGMHQEEVVVEDGDVPSVAAVEEFLNVCEEVAGPIVVMCKSGTGTAGTMIAVWLIKFWRIAAAEAISIVRIFRPGCIVGGQQQFLEQIQESRWIGNMPLLPTARTPSTSFFSAPARAASSSTLASTRTGSPSTVGRHNNCVSPIIVSPPTDGPLSSLGKDVGLSSSSRTPQHTSRNQMLSQAVAHHSLSSHPSYALQHQPPLSPTASSHNAAEPQPLSSSPSCIEEVHMQESISGRGNLSSPKSSSSPLMSPSLVHATRQLAPTPALSDASPNCSNNSSSSNGNSNGNNAQDTQKPLVRPQSPKTAAVSSPKAFPPSIMVFRDQSSDNNSADELESPSKLSTSPVLFNLPSPGTSPRATSEVILDAFGNTEPIEIESHEPDTAGTGTQASQVKQGESGLERMVNAATATSSNASSGSSSPLLGGLYTLNARRKTGKSASFHGDVPTSPSLQCGTSPQLSGLYSPKASHGSNNASFHGVIRSTSPCLLGEERKSSEHREGKMSPKYALGLLSRIPSADTSADAAVFGVKDELVHDLGVAVSNGKLVSPVGANPSPLLAYNDSSAPSTPMLGGLFAPRSRRMSLHNSTIDLQDNAGERSISPVMLGGLYSMNVPRRRSSSNSTGVADEGGGGQTRTHEHSVPDADAQGRKSPILRSSDYQRNPGEHNSPTSPKAGSNQAQAHVLNTAATSTVCSLSVSTTMDGLRLPVSLSTPSSTLPTPSSTLPTPSSSFPTPSSPCNAPDVRAVASPSLLILAPSITKAGTGLMSPCILNPPSSPSTLHPNPKPSPLLSACAGDGASPSLCAQRRTTSSLLVRRKENKENKLHQDHHEAEAGASAATTAVAGGAFGIGGAEEAYYKVCGEALSDKILSWRQG